MMILWTKLIVTGSSSEQVIGKHKPVISVDAVTTLSLLYK